MLNDILSNPHCCDCNDSHRGQREHFARNTHMGSTVSMPNSNSMKKTAFNQVKRINSFDKSMLELQFDLCHL